MTTIMQIDFKCSICGMKRKYSVIGSTNTFGGGPDLDSRPAEMQRSTMPMWVQECPACGYVSTEVSDSTGIDKAFLQTERYTTCDGIGFASELAMRFYKQYLISLADENVEEAFDAILHAAWACDDKEDKVNAKKCRELAIPLAEKLVESDSDYKDNISIIRADLLRRAGQFDELSDSYAGARFGQEILNQILQFEIKKAKEGDTACYRVEDVTEV